MNSRHTSEDLHYLREQGFVQTADEIERLHKVEDTLGRLKDKIDTRLNDYLCEMKPDYDDSITGFNEAWDVVRKIFAEASGKPATVAEAIENIRQDLREIVGG